MADLITCLRLQLKITLDQCEKLINADEDLREGCIPCPNYHDAKMRTLDTLEEKYSNYSFSPFKKEAPSTGRTRQMCDDKECAATDNEDCIECPDFKPRVRAPRAIHIPQKEEPVLSEQGQKDYEAFVERIPAVLESIDPILSAPSGDCIRRTDCDQASGCAAKTDEDCVDCKDFKVKKPSSVLPTGPSEPKLPPMPPPSEKSFRERAESKTIDARVAGCVLPSLKGPLGEVVKPSDFPNTPVIMRERKHASALEKRLASIAKYANPPAPPQLSMEENLPPIEDDGSDEDIEGITPRDLPVNVSVTEISLDKTIPMLDEKTNEEPSQEEPASVEPPEDNSDEDVPPIQDSPKEEFEVTYMNVAKVLGITTEYLRRVIQIVNNGRVKKDTHASRLVGLMEKYNFAIPDIKIASSRYKNVPTIMQGQPKQEPPKSEKQLSDYPLEDLMTEVASRFKQGIKIEIPGWGQYKP